MVRLAALASRPGHIVSLLHNYTWNTRGRFVTRLCEQASNAVCTNPQSRICVCISDRCVLCLCWQAVIGCMSLLPESPKDLASLLHTSLLSKPEAVC